MKTVLVTGATGALGQAVVSFLKASGKFHVVRTSRQENDDFVQLDILNNKQVGRILERIKPDFLFHLAATFSNDFEEAYGINVQGTKVILDQIALQGLSTRVLLIGSAAEYGVVAPEENPIAEERFSHTVSIYGLTKSWQTQLAFLYAAKSVDVVVARVFNLDSPNCSDRLFIGRLHRQLKQVLSGQREEMEFGRLDAVRDYINMEQAVEQIMKIVQFGERGKVYNVGSGKPVMMRDIVKQYLNEYNLSFSIVREAEKLSNRTGYDVPVIYADMSRTFDLGT